MIDAAIQMTLVPGSIWNKESKRGKTFSSTVLFVTNVDRDEDFQERFPPQVVFLSDKREVTSMSVDDFTATRHFFDMDTNMEALLSMITADPEEEDDENLDDLDGIVLDGDASELPGEPDEAEVIDDEPTEVGAGSTISTNPPVQPFKLTELHEYAELMEANFQHYEQLLPFTKGTTLHCIKLSLDNGLTKEMLEAAFGEEDRDSAMSVNGFSLRTANSVQIFNVDTFVAVTIEVQSLGAEIGCVYVESLDNVPEMIPVAIPVTNTLTGGIMLVAGATLDPVITQVSQQPQALNLAVEHRV